jgi:hypothetical protein
MPSSKNGIASCLGIAPVQQLQTVAVSAANDPQGATHTRLRLARRTLLWLTVASGLALLGFIGWISTL